MIYHKEQIKHFKEIPVPYVEKSVGEIDLPRASLMII